MPVEIIPKKPVKAPLWHNIIFYFSIVLLLAALPNYFILRHFQKKVSQTVQKIEADIEVTEASQKALKANLKSKKEKIDDFSVVFSNHRLNSKVFPLLQSLTHPKVFFSSLNLDSTALNLSLGGATESFQSLGQQIFILRDAREIQDIELAGVSMGRAGEIIFSLSLSLDPQTFK